ncbi:GIY-YIG nuclease family protein [Candidatus Nomurabacteria bacterium]|nr:GIY-YIG nuclease family protein [Candidatus Nomurabacteria bacterium]
MTYFVYILYSQKDHKLYIGCTGDLENRIKEHNSKKVTATKKRIPLVLIHSEKFEDKAKAFNRERFLKSLCSGRFKRKILKEYLNTIGHD